MYSCISADCLFWFCPLPVSWLRVSLSPSCLVMFCFFVQMSDCSVKPVWLLALYGSVRVLYSWQCLILWKTNFHPSLYQSIVSELCVKRVCLMNLCQQHLNSAHSHWSYRECSTLKPEVIETHLVPNVDERLENGQGTMIFWPHWCYRSVNNKTNFKQYLLQYLHNKNTAHWQKANSCFYNNTIHGYTIFHLHVRCRNLELQGYHC